jgi:hypothetical protein
LPWLPPIKNGDRRAASVSIKAAPLSARKPVLAGVELGADFLVAQIALERHEDDIDVIIFHAQFFTLLIQRIRTSVSFSPAMFKAQS